MTGPDDVGVVTGVAAAQVGRVFREESGRSLATLIRIFGQIDLAEDAVQEAFALAVRKWPQDGLPPNPGGWITTTARNRATDRLRREARGRALLREVAMLQPVAEEHTGDPLDDDRLRLIFTCCHPALSLEAQVALTLRLLGGLSTDQVARAFLVSEATMAQRLVRAKRKIKVAHIPYRVPAEHELRRAAAARAHRCLPRLQRRRGRTRRRARRRRRLARGGHPPRPHARGPDARRARGGGPARAAPADRVPAPLPAHRRGSLILLRDQDRTRWDRTLIAEGQALVAACLRRGQLGPYQLQAAINAVHAGAGSVEETDWTRIVALYDQLLSVAPTPVIKLNRAVAVGEVDGPAAGLALLDALDLGNYHPFHAARADMLRRLRRPGEAADAYRLAASLAPTVAQRNFLAAQARRLSTS